MGLICKAPYCGEEVNGSDEYCLKHGLMVLDGAIALCEICDAVIWQPAYLIGEPRICHVCKPWMHTALLRRSYKLEVAVPKDSRKQVAQDLAGSIMSAKETLTGEYDRQQVGFIEEAFLAGQLQMALQTMRRLEFRTEIADQLAKLEERIVLLPEGHQNGYLTLLAQIETNLAADHIGACWVLVNEVAGGMEGLLRLSAGHVRMNTTSRQREATSSVKARLANEEAVRQMFAGATPT